MASFILILLAVLGLAGVSSPLAPFAAYVFATATVLDTNYNTAYANDLETGGTTQTLAPAATLPAITLRSVLCPTPYTGPDFATACISPVADIAFTLTRLPGITQDGTTGIAGSISFTDLTPDVYDVRGGPPGEFVENAIGCHQTADPTVPVLFFPQDNQTIRLGLALGDDVTCIWYSVPEDLRGDG